MVPLNTAQRILLALGVDHQQLLLAHLKGRQPSHRKTGPGRKHSQGKPEAAAESAVQL